MGLKKIVLVSTGQPSCNPRIVKEADAFAAAGFDVTLLYCFFISWAQEKDKSLLKKAGWKFIMVGGSPSKNKLLFLFTRFRNRLCRLLNRWGVHQFLFAERTQARCYDELLKKAKKIKADWYIGHNLGTLSVVVKAAAYHKAKAGFDFEDYHRGEFLPDDSINLERIFYLEKKYLYLLNYISAASSMILKAVSKDFPALPIPVIIVNNCFALKQQPPYRKKNITSSGLTLFWFSQTIGRNRGLELLVEALLINNDPSVSLVLAGRCDEDMVTYIDQKAGFVKSSIHFAGIIEPEELPAFASQFDVGMAIELQEPYNRNICLTNKIFTYLLAGNAIILSETSMQSEFNSIYKVGQSFAASNAHALAEKIKVYKNIVKLNAQRCHNYKLAKEELNWEKESEKLLALIN